MSSRHASSRDPGPFKGARFRLKACRNDNKLTSPRTRTSNFYKKDYTSAILGTRLFKQGYLEALDKGKIEMSKADYRRTIELLLMSEINAACMKYFKISERELYNCRRGKINDRRKIGMYACRQWGCETLANIAKQYRCKSSANVSKAVSSIKRRMEDGSKLRKIVQELEIIVLRRGNI